MSSAPAASHHHPPGVEPRRLHDDGSPPFSGCRGSTAIFACADAPGCRHDRDALGGSTMFHPMLTKHSLRTYSFARPAAVVTLFVALFVPLDASAAPGQFAADGWSI